MLLLLLLLLFANLVSSSLVPTPPMGWSTWEAFAKGLSEDKILANTRILKSSGLFAKGYKMIQIDDGWMKFDETTGWVSRENYEHAPPEFRFPLAQMRSQQDLLRANGPLGCPMPDLSKFPRGMKALGDDLKSAGFKWGLYTSGEDLYCHPDPGFNPYFGSSEYLNVRNRDVRCFKEWGVQLMKIDFCQPELRNKVYVRRTLQFWSKTLGPSVVMYNSRYLCMAPTSCGQTTVCPMRTIAKQNAKIPKFCSQYSHLARTGPDVKPNWGSILGAISTRFGRGKVSKPGFWSDPDYLLPHPTELTFVERRSQFSMWCITSSPLFISTDLTKVDSATLNMLGNEEAIEINQRYVKDAGDLLRKLPNDLWQFRKTANPFFFAVLIVNVGADLNKFSLGSGEREWSPNFADYSIHGPLVAGSKVRATNCQYRNIWTGEEGTITAQSVFTIPERDCLFIKVFNCRVNA